ncbi:MAG: S41 family peptidase [Anaerolineales bacterium]|nr:S41 family peptidase [Anaerolineales bacterium]
MSENNASSRGRLLILIIGLLLVALVMAGVGFVIGRSSAQPQTITETVTETVSQSLEVTREVKVIETVVVTPTVEAVFAEESTMVPSEAAVPVEPTAVPTAVPQRLSEFDPEDLDFATFYEAWQLIGSDFDGEIPIDEELIQSAIAGSIETLGDDFTRYIKPDVAARLREDMSGSVSGIGAFVRETDEGLFEIVRPMDGQPADIAGLLPGDIVFEVDGESAFDLGFDEILLRVRGPEGSTVVIKVIREGEAEPLEFSIVRTEYEVPVVESEMLEKDGQQFAYVRLTTFNRNAETAVLAALAELLPQNPAGIIFDLRDNGGGFLDQSVSVADIFLPEGVVLYERNNKGLEEVFQSDDGDVGESLPLVVLVNPGSASASEIVAGAIQDNQRGILIGETTFGKGSVQQVNTLSDGAELRVTIARWYTPANNSIDKAGITPDIEVESPLDLGGEDDTQLQRALEFLLNGE